MLVCIRKFTSTLFLTLTLASPGYAQNNIKLEFHGIPVNALKNVQAIFDETITSNAYLTKKQTYDFYKQAPEKIRLALEPYGYFKPIIQSRLIYKHTYWLAIFYINPGIPMHITHITISINGPGKNNKAITHYIAHFPLQTGAVFNSEDYEAAKQKLFNLARNQGFLKATFDNTISIDRKKYQCSIKIALNTGEKFYFGQVIYNTHPYSAHFLNRIVSFSRNEPFSSSKLITLQQTMENSYYFQQVAITPDLMNIENRQIPIHVYMIPPKAKRYHFGFGYGTLSGPRITAGLSLRHLGNNGHHLESELQLSPVLSNLTANYYIPGKNPLMDEWVLAANLKTFKPKSGWSESFILTAGYAKKMNNTRINYNLNFLEERFSIFSITNSPIMYAHQLYPNLRVSYVKVDNLINPSHGILCSFNIQGAYRPFLSSTSFIQPQLDAKYIVSPFSFAHIILKGDLGYTAVSNLNQFPFSMRYFAGGVNSIRGFANSSIGPGRYLTIGSLEYRNKLINNWYGAVFYDIGTASNQFGLPLNRGSGIGIIYESMVGPIKIYGAKALSKTTQPFS